MPGEHDVALRTQPRPQNVAWGREPPPPMKAAFPETHAAVCVDEIPHAGAEFIQTSSGAKPAFRAPLRTDNLSFGGLQKCN